MRLEVQTSLKLKAANQPLSATQDLISQILGETCADVNQTLPNLEFLAPVVQRSPASASRSAEHPEL